VRARILYVDPATKQVSLTLRPQLVALETVTFSASVRQRSKRGRRWRMLMNGC